MVEKRTCDPGACGSRPLGNPGGGNGQSLPAVAHCYGLRAWIALADLKGFGGYGSSRVANIMTVPTLTMCASCSPEAVWRSCLNRSNIKQHGIQRNR